MDEIGKKIKEIRISQKMSQAKFGEQFNVSQDTVSLWETGKSLPGIADVIDICKKYQISSDYLLGLTDF